MKLFKKGQGATEYLLMLAAVLVIVAIAVYYITTTTPSATITGSATIKSGDNTVVVFTPTSVVGTPENIPGADWGWAIYRDGTQIGTTNPETRSLVKNVPIELDVGASAVAANDTVKLWYKGSSIGTAATVSA